MSLYMQDYKSLRPAVTMCDTLVNRHTNTVAVISSEWWGDGGLEAEPPAGSRGRAPGQGVREASPQPKCWG